MDKFIGKKLDGRYEIQEIIGVGGMAIVYKAYDSIDDRIVAVKILRDEYLTNEEFRRRFKNESKAIAVLSHPNIVKVYDVSLGDRLQYIVMEYIDGITLKEYIEQQKDIRWKEAVHFAQQILRALQHAHDKGIVHRDIKPQNIMLLQDGTIKVTDFGIARFSRIENRTLAMGEKAIGSVHYISPEQARGQVTDEKADIYSLGVMLYEMLTGTLPFDSDSPVSIAIMQLQSEPRRPRELNDTIPEGLEEIIMRAMQKDPEKRYQSAAEMLKDIDEFKRNPSIHFEYKYFIDNAPTKYVDAIKKVKDKDEKEEDEVVAGSSNTIPILAGVAAAFVVFAIAFVLVLFWLNNSRVPSIVMPNMVGMTVEEVRNQYPKLKIVEEATEYNQDYEEGVIFDMSPPYRPNFQVKENATFHVKVSLGKRKLKVPDVYGLDKVTAINTLRNENLNVKEILNYDDETPVDFVIKTSPERGQEIFEGQDIQVFISLGKPIEPVEVPLLIGLNLESAKRKLEEKGLTLGEVMEINDSSPAGTVKECVPDEGTVINKGDKVDLKVSNGIPAGDPNVKISFELPEVYTPVTLTIYFKGKLVRTERIDIPADRGTYEYTFEGTGIGNAVRVKLNGKDYATTTIDFINGTYEPIQYTSVDLDPSSSPGSTGSDGESSSEDGGSSSEDEDWD